MGNLVPHHPFYPAFDLFFRTAVGLDVFLEYDPTYLKIEEKNKNQKTDALKYLDTKFSEFDIFPYFKIDEENGSIIFLAFMKPLKGFVGANSKVAEITFKALKKGNTEIKFKFKKNYIFLI